jgi:hypothetical protein
VNFTGNFGRVIEVSNILVTNLQEIFRLFLCGLLFPCPTLLLPSLYLSNTLAFFLPLEDFNENVQRVMTYLSLSINIVTNYFIRLSEIIIKHLPISTKE